MNDVTHDQPNKNVTAPKYKIYIGILFSIIAILVIIFMLKKQSNGKSISTVPVFNKQGELIIQKKDGRSIVTIDIEIADDDSKREVGMMERQSMEERQGMLFILEEEQMASFWMRNCILPLDMIFVNKIGEIITICKNTTPFSEQTYSATGLTLFVLEVNAGFTDKYDVKVGDTINWKRM